MSSSRDDFGIAFRSALLQRGAAQKFSLVFLIILASIIFLFDVYGFSFMKPVRSIINDVIEDAMEPKKVSQVGLHLMKFCAKHDMQRIADNVQQYAEALNAKYA